MDATDVLVDGQANEPLVIDLRDGAEPDHRSAAGVTPARRSAEQLPWSDSWSSSQSSSRGSWAVAPTRRARPSPARP